MVLENIPTHLKEGYRKFQGGGGGEGEKAKIVSKLNKSMNQKFVKFPEEWGRFKQNKPH